MKKHLKKAVSAGRRRIKEAAETVLYRKFRKIEKRKHVVFRSAKKVVIFEWPEKKK